MPRPNPSSQWVESNSAAITLFSLTPDGLTALPASAVSVIRMTLTAESPPEGDSVDAQIYVDGSPVDDLLVSVAIAQTEPSSTETFEPGRYPIYENEAAEVQVSAQDLSAPVWVSGRISVRPFARTLELGLPYVATSDAAVVSATAWADPAPIGGTLNVALYVNDVSVLSLDLASGEDTASLSPDPALPIETGDTLRWQAEGTQTNAPQVWGILTLQG